MRGVSCFWAGHWCVGSAELRQQNQFLKNCRSGCSQTLNLQQHCKAKMCGQQWGHVTQQQVWSIEAVSCPWSFQHLELFYLQICGRSQSELVVRLPCLDEASCSAALWQPSGRSCWVDYTGHIIVLRDGLYNVEDVSFLNIPRWFLSTVCCLVRACSSSFVCSNIYIDCHTRLWFRMSTSRSDKVTLQSQTRRP